jgi:hypothetical protein
MNKNQENQNGIRQSNAIKSSKNFRIKLPTETISLYLLCCGIKDAGLSLTTKNILERWNGTEESISKSDQRT